MRKLIELKDGEPMPNDFWNYNVNPILGYKHETIRRVLSKEKTKYGLKPLPNKR